jgi:hypothetical protein
VSALRVVPARVGLGAALAAALAFAAAAARAEPPAPASPARAEPPPVSSAAAPQPTAPRWEVAAVGGVRLRGLKSPFVVGRLGARIGWIAGPARLFVELGAERGGTSRATGSVVALLVDAAAGASLRALTRGIFNLSLQATGGATWVDFQGTHPALDVRAQSVSGVVGEASVGLVPGLRLGSVQVGLLLEGGATFSRARAHVAADRDVSLAGAWVGAGVMIAPAESGR